MKPLYLSMQKIDNHTAVSFLYFFTIKVSNEQANLFYVKLGFLINNIWKWDIFRFFFIGNMYNMYVLIKLSIPFKNHPLKYQRVQH